VKLAAKVVGCGNTSGAKTDKFATFGLTPTAARRIQAPLIDECYANLECKVVDTRMTNKYCFFVLEVIKAWIDPRGETPADDASSRIRRLYGCGPDDSVAFQDEIASFQIQVRPLVRGHECSHERRVKSLKTIKTIAKSGHDRAHGAGGQAKRGGLSQAACFPISLWHMGLAGAITGLC